MDKIQKIYINLVQEYNNNQWFRLCSLERFLQIKAESALNKGYIGIYNALLDVIAYAENDY